MSRTRASVPPEAIRIEDEVWQEAFTRREPARQRPRRLHAVESPRPSSTRVATSAPPEPARPAMRQTGPRPVAAARPVVSELRDSHAAVRESHAAETPSRRTVTIRGHGAERNLPWPDSPRRRPQRLAHERVGLRPDRVALWAVMLGILLVVVAIASS
jgi:hypothetical protein